MPSVSSTMKLVLVALSGPAALAANLRNASVNLAAPTQMTPASVALHAQNQTSVTAPPCQCMANNAAWKKTTRTTPKCIFIDLGAADGNTFHDFLNNKYGPVANCPNGGDWEAYLVEANPHFDTPVKALAKEYPGKVHAMASTAAFMCQGQTSFYIDADPTHNHWGSSMSDNSPDAIKSGKQKVTVPTMNVAQLLAESVLPDDWVMLKVDIEGAEYDVIPCLAESTDATLVDRMYLEEHTWFKTGSANGPKEMAAAKSKLTAMHVDIPQYFTNTM